MIFVILATIAFVGLYFGLRKPKQVGAIHANKCHFFPKFQFSTQEFYAIVEQIMSAHQLPDVKMSRVFYHEKNIFSDKREYLRIERKNDIFDICAAPVGTAFFVSYWYGEPKRQILAMALKTPYVGTAVEGWQGTTYYQIDSANIFTACVKESLLEAIEQVTTSKGFRGFSESERSAFSA